MSTPPNPYGPPQPAPAGPSAGSPYGAPVPPPSVPYGPPPGYGAPPQPAPAGFGPPPSYGQAPTAPPAKRSGLSRLRTVGLVGGGLALAVGYFVAGPSASSAKPGDCVRVSGTRNVEILKCSDAKANYRVLSKFEGTGDVTRCRQTPQTTSTVAGKSGRRWNTKRYVLCLGPLAPATTGVPPVKKS
ncbi:hypothetical protein [Kitasatospora sp. NPDC086791]|uniref:LppU/SCO3897 family protein n=1 Tax=Kitasatospora sp. NPDC086791 TaxID=3155178 RepID=UPI0034451AED